MADNNEISLDLLEAKLVLADDSGPNGDRMHIGYGRDVEEARANAGFSDPSNDNEQFTEITITNKDEIFSKEVATRVCWFHIHEDEDLPEEVRDELARLFNSGLYAEVVDYCFNMVWDKGYEQL